ncbi:MAG: tetratricopeptide repeat protein [Candidatus Omnitrophica bacterium]|nr:tetratricopeptide repeat protein [Candidatus Omnitrophota bacterium]
MRKYILIIILFVTITYSNSLLNEFTGDDNYTIYKNRFIKSWQNFSLLASKEYMSNPNDVIFNSYHETDYNSGEITYRPMVTLSYMADYSIWKLDPLGYHFTNILFHAFNAVLLYIFILLLVNNNLLALLASLLFATHPINTEIVNSISAREDLLVAFFLLSAFILFIKYRKYTGVKKAFLYIASSFLYFLGTLSKETAIVFPMLVALYDFLFVFNFSFKKIINSIKSRYAGFIAATLAYFYIYFLVFTPTSGLGTPFAGRNLYVHILTSIKIIARYICASFIPVNIAIIPSFYAPLTKTIFDFEIILSILIIILLVVLFLRVFRRSKLVAFGIAWFFIAMLPTSNILRLVNMFSFRYTYLPVIGFCIVIAVLALKFSNLAFVKKISPHADKIIMIFLIGIFMATAFPQNIFWRNNFTCGQSQLMYYPFTDQPYQAMGKYCFDAGQIKEAAKNLKMAIKYNSLSPLPYSDLGVCYIYLGELDKAIETLKKAIQLRPSFSEAYYNLGMAYLYKDELNNARDTFLAAVKLDPAYAEAQNNLAVTYIQLGQFEDAKKVLENLLQISPNNTLALENLKIVEESSKK